MRILVFGILIAAVMSVSAFGQGKSNIQGVWQLSEVTTTGTNGRTVTVSQPSMYLFTKNHYSIIYVASDKPRPVMEDYSKATQEELLETFVRDFVANAGTYEIKGGKLTMHPMVAKSPGYMQAGTWSTSSMTIKGDAMTLVTESSNSGPSKNPTTFKLTRVE